MPKKMTITQELLLIKKRSGGVLRPADVVAYAKSPSTALHNRFEWDDGEAAQRYRLWQARQIISLELVVVNKHPQETGDIVLSVTDENSNDPRVRKFVSLKSDRFDGAQGYRMLSDVLSDGDLRAQLLDDAKDEMRTFQKKYKSLAELVRVIEAMDEVLIPKKARAAA